MRHRFALGVVLAIVGASCAGSPAQPRRVDAEATVPAASGAATRSAPQASPVVPERAASASPSLEPILVVTDPDALRAVAHAVGDFGTLLMGSAQAAPSNAALSDTAAYRSITDVVERDVRAIGSADPNAGVGVARHLHRLFDVRWLHAPSAHFELIGVANRVDRAALDQSACGETRLVYRLGYERMDGTTRMVSRLPMTLIAEFRAPELAEDDRCRRVAQRWLAPPDLHGAALGAWLAGEQGPLARDRLMRSNLIQLGVNFQSVRWPSGARADLGGHAEYVLRAFAWDAQAARYRPRRLENTPDVSRLTRDAQARAALRSWIVAPDNLKRVDSGAALIPDEFLAESAVSVTPRGFARLQNRAYRRLFEPSDFAAIDLAGLRFATSPEALVRRLDDLTCNGCHQSRSIAGFHLIGEESEPAPGNALAVALSPHASGDLERRKAYLLGLARGDAVDAARPFAERAAGDAGGYGAHCGLGDPGFASWACQPGLHCSAYEAPLGDASVGVCLPDRLAVGDPCQPGRVQSNRDSHRDRAQRASELACDYVCEAASVGFPGGMCASPCDARMPSDATCGGIAILSDFNDCLARREPFARCVEQHVRPAGLRACSAQAPCRDDYICARTASGTGACLPPYFVFQMRVDGHP